MVSINCIVLFIFINFNFCLLKSEYIKWLFFPCIIVLLFNVVLFLLWDKHSEYRWPISCFLFKHQNFELVSFSPPDFVVGLLTTCCSFFFLAAISIPLSALLIFITADTSSNVKELMSTICLSFFASFLFDMGDFKMCHSPLHWSSAGDSTPVARVELPVNYSRRSPPTSLLFFVVPWFCWSCWHPLLNSDFFFFFPTNIRVMKVSVAYPPVCNLFDPRFVQVIIKVMIQHELIHLVHPVTFVDSHISWQTSHLCPWRKHLPQSLEIPL